MKTDRILTIFAFVFGITGALFVTRGKFIFGGALFAVGLAIFFFRGSSKFNVRSQYEKICRTFGVTIADVYELLKDMDTPLGKPWIALHRGYSGDSIVFGPNEFKDMIVISISDKKPEFSIKHINKVENIQLKNKEDARRFDKILPPDSMDVTPKTYSHFAAEKIMCAKMLNDLIRILEKYTADIEPEIPANYGKYNTFYYNSGDGFVRDLKGSKYMKLENQYEPFLTRALDVDTGEEIANIVPRAYNKKGRVIDKAGFDMYADGKHYADITRHISFKHDTFTIDVDKVTEFTAENYAAIQRANIKSNYTIKLNDEVKAIIAGNPNLDFDDIGLSKQYVILSYDDDYLTFYASFINFLMTLNSFIK